MSRRLSRILLYALVVQAAARAAIFPSLVRRFAYLRALGNRWVRVRQSQLSLVRDML